MNARQLEDGFTLEPLLEYKRSVGRRVTFTQVALVPAFIRERGIVETYHRHNYAATDSAHLHAMIEYNPFANQMRPSR